MAFEQTDARIHRLRGYRASIFNRCRSCRQTCGLLLMFTVMMAVMMMEMNKFDNLKGIFVEYGFRESYSYNVSE